MANNTEQLREKLSIILDAYKRYVRDDGPRPFAKLQTKLTKKLTLDEIHALIEAEATRREQALKDELLFDLDEIDNKPWRVFRQLANIMPEYADTYTDYEAFYSYGGGNEVQKLIKAFKQTDDYKQSGFKEKSELLMAELKRQAEGGDDNV